MTHPGYAWMFYNWYTNNWWSVSTSFDCTIDTRKRFLEYSLVFDHYPRIKDDEKNKPNVAGMVRN